MRLLAAQAAIEVINRHSLICRRALVDSSLVVLLLDVVGLVGDSVFDGVCKRALAFSHLSCVR